MFEKEAEERARKLEESQTLGIYGSEEDLKYDEGYNRGEVAGYEEGFQDGAEFGYNKGRNEAKEIIKKISGFIQAFGCGPSTDNLVAEAQQFLKESE